MQRFPCSPRHDWERRIVETGIVYSATELPDGSTRSYWRETGYYAFTEGEVLELEQHAPVIFNMLVEAGDYVYNLPPKARTELLLKMGIPRIAHEAVLKTWNEEPACQSVYGRFDLRYLGEGTIPQLYEFNAQTPTCLPEAANAQWYWNEETGHGYDQWNSIWEKLVEAWRRNLSEIGKKLGYDPNAHPDHKPTIYFAHSNSETSGEDEINTSYLASACLKAGYNTRMIWVEDIKLGLDGRFYIPKQGCERQEEFDAADLEHIDACFLLYPWEMMWEHDTEWVEALFADMKNVGLTDHVGNYTGGTVWFEAPYKMLWSNKAILPLLWKLFGNDPALSKYLIPAWFAGEQPAELRDYVEKPLFAREGANIRIHRNGELVRETDGVYGSDDPHDYIVQAYAPPPVFVDEDGQDVHAIVGVWMIDGEPAGMGIREDETVITTNIGFFVPHTIAAPQPITAVLARA